MKSNSDCPQKQVLVDDRTYNVIAVRKGGMGRVWLLEQAFNEPFDRIYLPKLAVKTFDYVADQNAVEQELNIWISLEHPYILPLIKIGRLNFKLAAIMPRLQCSLADILRNVGKFDEVTTSGIILEIVGGLQYAWLKHRILHLDLKPANVLVKNGKALHVSIADWGISRLAQYHRKSTASSRNESHNELTAFGAGTPLYMAPERFSEYWLLSPAVDIFALGFMAIQLRKGLLPVRSDQMDPRIDILSGKYFKIAQEILSDCSENFRQFCLECIEPDQGKRINSYQSIIERLAIIIRRGNR